MFNIWILFPHFLLINIQTEILVLKLYKSTKITDMKILVQVTDSRGWPVSDRSDFRGFFARK